MELSQTDFSYLRASIAIIAGSIPPFFDIIIITIIMAIDAEDAIAEGTKGPAMAIAAPAPLPSAPV